MGFVVGFDNELVGEGVRVVEEEVAGFAVDLVLVGLTLGDARFSTFEGGSVAALHQVAGDADGVSPEQVAIVAPKLERAIGVCGDGFDRQQATELFGCHRLLAFVEPVIVLDLKQALFDLVSYPSLP